MNITRKNIDDLNAIITIEIVKSDYSDQLEKEMWQYRKTAALPGFRKGSAPVSVIEKKYRKPALLEAINKQVQAALNKYLQENKMNILGNPIPKADETIDWDGDDFTFEFEIGLTPQFDINLDAAQNVVKYKVIANDELLDEQVARIQKQYGKQVSQGEVAADTDVTITFKNEEKEIEHTATIALDEFKDQKTIDALLGKKVEDVVTLNTKDLFKDDHKLMEYLGVGHDDVHNLAIDVTATIDEINISEPADLNQDLFDKLFGEGKIASVDELKEKIKEDAERQFAQQADQKFLSDVSEALISDTKFDLPESFLKRWIMTAGETPLTAEQAEVEYAKSEKGLRYQLIEGRLMQQNNIQVSFEDLKGYAAAIIRQQMAQFGQTDPTDAEVEGIVARVLGNQEEVKRLSAQVMSEKMLALFKGKNSEEKEITYDSFVKEMYGE
ncbi:trigger factor [Flavobacterium ardleyense]|uniref:trigger factor n=1 Tax=Flavobacterium ardleyense TaxID=2038737 RepID=UPI00298D09BC|nr:trigger factor [Flavobacterium ardleyense]